MSSLSDVYRTRANRYGTTYQERLQGKREDEFQHYLNKSVYRVEFKYNNKTIYGSLERNRQDQTQTLQYLLVDINTVFNAGTILTINNQVWMVYYLENIKASGYNRYIVLKMTHQFSWKSNGITYTSYAYLYGQQNATLVDTIKSQTTNVIYTENFKNDFLVMPRNGNLKKDDYFEIGTAPYVDHYRVMGYDLQSTPGVEYVTIDHVYKYDLTAPPTKTSTDSDEDFYWITGGN